MSCEKDPDWEAVKRTVDYYTTNWLTVSGSTHYVGFLTDSKSNYRNYRAVTVPYKGHRKGRDKPKWLQAIRDYLVGHWKAQVMKGVEADDALTIAAEHFKTQGTEVIIVTDDKDLLQYPGLHYNKNKSSRVFRVSEEEGHYALWHQVITGDRTDNIPGVGHAASETATGTYNKRISESSLETKEKQKAYKRLPNSQLYGPAGAKKYLEGFKPEEYPAAVWQLYIDCYEDFDNDEGYGDLRFHEVFDLIFMLRKEPKGLIINYDIQEIPVDESLLDLFETYEF